MIYIKFVDPITYQNKFYKLEELKTLKSRCVEIVGYRVFENDTNIFVANALYGKNYKRVMNIPKKAIVEIVEDAVIVEAYTKEVSYQDTAITGAGVELTFEKIKNAPEPPTAITCGFVAYETETDLYLAMEKNEDGMYRTVTIIPKKFIL